MKSLLVALLLLVAIGGCRERAERPVEVATDMVQRGPFRLTVQVGPRQVQVGDQVRVDLLVNTPDGYQVRFPSEQDFGDLPAREAASPLPRPGASGLVWRRTFVLEPVASGTLEIPPLVVKYRRAERPETQPGSPGQGAEAEATSGAASMPSAHALAYEESELVSGSLKVEVTSVLTAHDDPTRPRDITGILLPPEPSMPTWQRILLGAMVGLSAAGGYAAYWLVRRRARRPPPPVLPEVWALQALRQLDDPAWLAPEHLREYYYRLTEIIRTYIERKFGLAAPEMTTQEFLLALARDRGALPYDANRLRAFLEACDFVKYAALRPSPQDAQHMLSTARAFVDATAASAARVSEPSARSVTGGQAA